MPFWGRVCSEVVECWLSNSGTRVRSQYPVMWILRNTFYIKTSRNVFIELIAFRIDKEPHFLLAWDPSMPSCVVVGVYRLQGTIKVHSEVLSYTCLVHTLVKCLDSRLWPKRFPRKPHLSDLVTTNNLTGQHWGIEFVSHR